MAIWDRGVKKGNNLDMGDYRFSTDEPVMVSIRCISCLLPFVMFLCSCEVDIDEDPIEQEKTIYITSDDYRVVSKMSSELLSCGPVSATHSNGLMTLVYLADENSHIETESSTSIFMRAARLNLYNKEEDVQFLAESAFADACCPGNPRDTSVEEIVGLYHSLM